MNIAANGAPPPLPHGGPARSSMRLRLLCIVGVLVLWATLLAATAMRCGYGQSATPLTPAESLAMAGR